MSDVPILGGTEAQQDAARQELAAFDEWTGGWLELAWLEFTPLKDGLIARFSPTWHRVQLKETLEVDQVRIAIRHELCHALDHAVDLMKDQNAAFDAYGEQLYDRSEGVLDSRRDARGRRSEALALMCESGPLAAASLSEPCPGDPPAADGMFGLLSREVWTHYDGISVPLPDPQATAGPYDPWDYFHLAPTASQDRVDLTLGEATSDGIDESLRQVELATGEPVPVSVTWADHRESVIEPPPPLPDEGLIDTLIGWSDGPAAGLATYSVVELGTFTARIIWFDGAQWTAVPGGCAAEDSAYREMFTADDRVWFASGDGETVSWSPIGE